MNVSSPIHRSIRFGVPRFLHVSLWQFRGSIKCAALVNVKLLFFVGQRPFGLVEFCGCNELVVWTVMTRAMTAYDVPEYPATVTAAGRFYASNGDTEAVGRQGF